MLEVVDAQRCRLTIRHRAEVPRHLEAAFVRLLDRGPELRARDVHVRLERGRAGVGPEVHHASRVVRTGQLVYLIEAESRTLEIRRRRIEPRPRLLARIDVALDPDVTEAIHVATGAHRRDAAGEIQSCEALGEVRVDTGSRGIEQVLVHHHQSRDDALPRQVDDLRAGGHRYRARVPQGGNHTVFDD